MPFRRLLHKHTTADSGFTLLEVFVVMVLIAIFTVMAVAQYSNSNVSLISQTQVLAAHLRYAQMRSLNTDSRWGILYDHNSGTYQLFKDATTHIVPLPGEDRASVNLGAMGISIASAISPSMPAVQDFDIRFDSWGSPLLSNTALTAPLSLQLNQIGQAPQTLTVTPNTGFIP
jgi:prepilin-type N-terminal cleavage/methylation domain-containing protein